MIGYTLLIQNPLRGYNAETLRSVNFSFWFMTSHQWCSCEFNYL